METIPKLKRSYPPALCRQATGLVLYTEIQRLARERKIAAIEENEKLKSKFYALYKNYSMLIRLRHWCMTHQADSLIQASYSSHPRNPE